MWHLLRTEIEYNAPVFFNIFISAVLGFLLLHFWPALFGAVSNVNVGYISICTMYFYFAAVMLSLPWAKEKRRRLLFSLPCPVRKIRMAHLALFTLYWIAIIALYIFFSALSRYFILDAAAALALLSQTGIVFILYSCVEITGVLQDSLWRKAIEISLFAIFAALTAAGIVHAYQRQQDAHFIDRVLSWIYLSRTGPILLVCLSFSLVLFILIFPWRKSYVES
ncbi:MAG: hypothetical protein JXB23_10035 [Candidatus Aminicenantes bacterium]|nr:hypothetical protein [Candidatus Aminicenantes bacterium]